MKTTAGSLLQTFSVLFFLSFCFSCTKEIDIPVSTLQPQVFCEVVLPSNGSIQTQFDVVAVAGSVNDPISEIGVYVSENLSGNPELNPLFLSPPLRVVNPKAVPDKAYVFRDIMRTTQLSTSKEYLYRAYAKTKTGKTVLGDIELF